jgi:integrase
VKDLILGPEQEHELEHYICGRIEWPAFTEEGEAANKTMKEHFSFLSGEAVQVIQEHIKRYHLKPDDLLLPVDVKMPRMWAYNKIMRALKALKLTERSGYLDRYTVHPHSFRSMKTSTEKRLGYTEEYAESTTGHSVGVRKAYEELEEMAEEWMLKVEPTLRFLE